MTGSGLGGATPVRDALASAVTAIAAARCDTPKLDAEVLLAHCLGVSRERLIVEGDRLEVSGPAVHAFREAVRRRAIEREPVAYITGRKGFRRIELEVDPRVLIPRPETELLVEVALRLPQRATVIDVGTGSGAVALALADERPDLEVWGSDVSADALAVARANGERLSLAVRWVQVDLLEGAPEVDAVVANLPYVARAETRLLAPEIARHEPRGALLAGEDGLGAIAPLLEQVGRRRRVQTVALEVGAGQVERVAAMMGKAGFHEVSVECDLAGIERVVSARRRRRIGGARAAIGRVRGSRVRGSSV